MMPMMGEGRPKPAPKGRKKSQSGRAFAVRAVRSM